MASSAATAVIDEVGVGEGKTSADRPKRAGRKRGTSGKSGTSAAKEPRVLKPGTQFQTEASRQATLNYARRTVWANLQRIIDSAIRQSLKQNYTAAKFLCEFAGVFAASDQEQEAQAESTSTAGAADPMQTFLTEVAETIGQ